MASVSDNFDRANSTNLGSNWSEDTGDWEIVSNALELVNGLGSDNYFVRWVGTALDSNDYYVEADVTTAASGTLNGPGVCARKAAGTGDANSDGYAYIFYDGDFSYLTEYADSVETVLDTGGAVSASTTYSNARLTANGSALSGTRDGAADVSATDSTYASGGVGCCWGSFGTQGGNINNWEAADLGGGPTTYTVTGGATAPGAAATVADSVVYVETGAGVAPASPALSPKLSPSASTPQKYWAEPTELNLTVNITVYGLL